MFRKSIVVHKNKNKSGFSGCLLLDLANIRFDLFIKISWNPFSNNMFFFSFKHKHIMFRFRSYLEPAK